MTADMRSAKWAAASCLGDSRFTDDHLAKEEVQVLKRICAACPVEADCLMFAASQPVAAEFVAAGLRWRNGKGK